MCTQYITVLIKVHSDYDCTNSTDTLDSSNYLSEVFAAVREGVREEDYIYEHENGAYGGAIFCFAFRCTEAELKQLIDKFETAVDIPVGTQFGFHSSFNGASSPFDKRTVKPLTIKKIYGSNKYDNLVLIADADQGGYSIADVFGDADFIDVGLIKTY